MCPYHRSVSPGTSSHTTLLGEDGEILGTEPRFSRFLGLAECRQDSFKQTLSLKSS